MAFGELLPPVIAKLMGDISDFQSKMLTAQGEMTKTEATGSAAFTKLAAVGKVATVALAAGAAGVAVASVKMADEFEKAHANLVTAVTNSGHKMTEFNKTIDLQHKSFENLGYANTEYEAALAALTTATNNPAKALQYMGVVADFAAKSHHSLEDSALAVGKALAGNLRPLKQLGLDLPIAASNAVKLEAAQVSLAKAQEHLTEVTAKHGATALEIKHATEAVTAAQDKVNASQTAGAEIVAELGKRMSGAAAAQAETFGGKLKVLEAQAQDLGIKIGLWLIPKLEELAAAISDGISWLEKHKTVAEAIGITIGTVLVAAIGAYIASLVVAAAESAVMFAQMLANVAAWAIGSEVRFGQAGAAAVAFGAEVEATSAVAGAALWGLLGPIGLVIAGIAAIRASGIGQGTDSQGDNGWDPSTWKAPWDDPGAWLPHFAAGGVVAGALGSPQLVVAHGGETIRNPGQEAALNGGGGGNNYQISVTAGVSSPADVGAAVVDAIAAYERRSGTRWRS